MALRDTRSVSRTCKFLSWQLGGSHVAAALGGVLVCFDVGFVLLHVAAAFWFPGNRMLYINVDQSYAEIFQGLKYVLVVVLLCCVVAVRRLWALLLWVPVFVGFFLDDLFQGHERAGAYVRSMFPPAMGERAQDVGELGVYALAAVVVGVVLWAGYRRGSPLTRWIYRVMACLLVLLALFGVGVDLLHSLFPPTSAAADTLMLVEDGGEMLVVTGFVAFAAQLLLGPLPADEGA
ncbi:hypothetical protein [Actinomyces sp. 2119]|uniref:hypothetical protein n=1 Tax=Actinomyces sp. 2119 TaxID=2321393 RepID=UPI0011C39D27|nr:hypothetical protein [Actinomyces sp. 2119]